MLSTLNPRPAFLAAIFVEQGTYNADNILLAPADGTPGAGLKEIISCEYDKKEGGLRMITRSKSAFRNEMEQAMPEKSPFRAILPLLEYALGNWQIELSRRELEHALGLSPMQSAFFGTGEVMEEEHRNILAFFLPWQPLIRSDLLLAEKCLQNALKQTVRLSRCRPLLRLEAGAVIDRNCTGLNFVIGGKVESPAPCVLVEIGPVPLEQLETFVPGGRHRRFLEEALLPCLLPEGWEWVVRIEVAPEHSGFRAGDHHTTSHIDIQSAVA